MGFSFWFVFSWFASFQFSGLRRWRKYEAERGLLSGNVSYPQGKSKNVKTRNGGERSEWGGHLVSLSKWLVFSASEVNLPDE